MKRKPSTEQREQRKLKAERRAAERGAVSAPIASSHSWEFPNRPGSSPRRIRITLAELAAIAKNVSDAEITEP